MPLLLAAVSVAVNACSADETIPEPLNAQARAAKKEAKERAADAKAVNAGFVPAQPAPLETASVDPAKVTAPGAMLPPATMQYRYIGRWAATTGLCEGGAWTFETRKLSTAGETSCDLPTVAAVPTGYELQGACEAEGKKTPQTLKLTFDERAKRMRVEGRTLGPATLLYCGD